MKSIERKNPEIREFLLRNISHHSNDITSLTIKKFGITRATVSRYIRNLIQENLVAAEGNTKARRYKLKKISDISFRIDVFRDLDEDSVWRFRLLPELQRLKVKQNIIDICQYGFTEMLNNVADHSASLDALISYEQTYADIKITVIDHGIGIFEKIQKDFNLSDSRSALLELSKGRLTSDKSRHAGEGIYFTSRMFGKYRIWSGNLLYSRTQKANEDGSLIETEDKDRNRKGTLVAMDISTDATWTTRSVFRKYQDDDLRFRKTHVPVSLGRYPGEQLVSRSQAKRILARFDNFSEVLLDFSGVLTIGQPFADEIFRIFKVNHPETPIVAINTTEDIDRMISYVQNNGPDISQPMLPGFDLDDV